MLQPNLRQKRNICESDAHKEIDVEESPLFVTVLIAEQLILYKVWSGVVYLFTKRLYMRRG